MLVYGLYLDNESEQVHQLPTWCCVKCVCVCVYNYRCFGLEKPGCYNSKGLKKRLKMYPLSLLMIQRQIILKREGMIQSEQRKNNQIRIVM